MEESKNDATLAELAKNGDVDAFKSLFDRYYVRLRLVATKILGSEEDASDICQEAFLKAYKNLDSFRGESSFYTWIYRIMYNLSIDLTRKASRKYEHTTDTGELPEYGSAANVSTIRTPEEEFYRGELSTAISQALKELSPSHRAVLMLREHDGMSYDEISNTLQCSVGTVMSRLHHARKKLTGILELALGEKKLIKQAGVQ